MTLSLGIDIGTSKVACAVVEGETSELCDVASLKTRGTQIKPGSRAEQNTSNILECVDEAIGQLSPERKLEVQAIGITGQMHGVLFWNSKTGHTSRLVTWQDGRCSEDGFLSELHGTLGNDGLKDGYGVSTIAWYNARKSGFLQEFDCSATIHDLLVTLICGLDKPVTDPSDAASWGCFDPYGEQWQTEDLAKVSFPTDILPSVVSCGTVVGTVSKAYSTRWGIPENTPVVAALGDNQASILATLTDPARDIGLTIGTGAQLSVVVDDPRRVNLASARIPGVEVRPFVDGKYLLVAATLCGGRSFEWLVESIQSFCSSLGLAVPERNDLYAKLDQLGRETSDSPLSVCSSFQGERHDPTLRGSISGIDLENFNLGNLFHSLTDDVIGGLKGMLPDQVFDGRSRVVGSGNGLRKLELTQELVEKAFGSPVVLQNTREEAAQGAALHGYRSVAATKC